MTYMSNINKFFNTERGSASLVALVKFLLLIVVIGFGIEFVKIQAIQKTLNTEIEIIAQDSLEMNLLDEYRREHVSLVKEEDVINSFYDIVKVEFNLDNSLRPIERGLLSKKLHIKEITVNEGKYTMGRSGNQNTECPSIQIKGYTEKPIVLISFLTKYNVKISFNISVKNSRYD